MPKWYVQIISDDNTGTGSIVLFIHDIEQGDKTVLLRGTMKLFTEMKLPHSSTVPIMIIRCLPILVTNGCSKRLFWRATLFISMK